jgi:Rrf2 family protein
MKANHQFSIAAHLMTCLGVHQGQGLTSAQLSLSVNAAPSFIRRTLSKLAKAGLVKTTRGKNGASILALESSRISMLDIYHAVEAPAAFAIHQYPEQKVCRVSCGYKTSMEKVLAKSQASFEQGLKKVSLLEVVREVEKS